MHKVGVETKRQAGRGRVMLDRDLLHILQHSLGLDQYGQGRDYRNHYVAGPDDVAKCRELVVMGYMTECQGNQLSGGDPIFMVTTQGRDCVALESPNSPNMTRSQQRYRHYLKVADCFNGFGDYLRYMNDQRKEQRKD
jgi:hypothetical protein